MPRIFAREGLGGNRAGGCRANGRHFAGMNYADGSAAFGIEQ